MGFCPISAVVLIVSLVSRGGLSEILLTPSNLILDSGGTGRVDVTCRLPATITASSLSVIRISRNTTAQPTVNQGLAAAIFSPTNTQGKAVLSSGGLLSSVATVSGSTNEKSVTLTMTQADCQYTGVYKCSVTYITGGDDNPVTNVLNDSQNLTVIVPPSNITTSLTPDNPSYTANDTVELFCNAVIGKYESGKPEEPIWKWEYLDQYGTWQEYTQESDIRKDNYVPLGICVYREACYLTLILSTEDSQRQYRCTVEQNGQKASATITLGVVSPENQGKTDQQTGTATANVTGAIVGGVIGGLVLIAIVIVLVYFLWYRKRDSGEKYTTRDAGPKPAEPPVPYPPPSGGDVSYSKSNNRFKNRETKGVDNKAMDEPSERPPPRYETHKAPRYDDDYRKGGRNPGFQEDERRAPRGRTNSSDDGGTDTASVGDGNPNFGTAI